MSIRIYLTGRVAFEVDGNVLIDERQFRGKQGRLVFAYLVSERSRPVPREQLARIAWPAEMASSWEASLSSLMSRLGTLLAADPLKSRGVSLSRSPGQYQIVLPTDTWVDLEASVSAIDKAEAALRDGNTRRISGSATAAANISARPFLPGIEGEWVESQRRRLERQLLRALDCLTQMWLAVGQPGLALEKAVQAIELDHYRESGYQLLMKAHVSCGNSAKAVDVYHRLRKLLDSELGTSPSAETEALYKDILD